MTHKVGWYQVFIILLLLGWTAAFAQAGQYNKLTNNAAATLQGIKSINVQVAPIDVDHEQEGLSQAEILENTKRQLQRAGIKLLSEKEYDRLRAVRNYPLAQLTVAVAVKNTRSDEAKIYSVMVSIRQAVFLSRKPVVQFIGPTWESNTIGYTQDLDVIQEDIKSGVTKFINAYFSANP